MTDQELLDWYKGGATKPENMTDQDYELTMNKALAAQKNQMLQDNLNAQQGAIAKAQTNAQQSASISNDKLMKYLGQKQLASGVASGQTGSDFINANNAYTQNRSEITNAASAQNTDLLQRYAGEKWQSDSDTFKTETGILDKYKNLAREDEQKEYDRNWNEEEREYNQKIYEEEREYKREQDECIKKQATQDEVFDYLTNDLMTGNFNSTAEMETRIEEFKDVLSPEKYALLKQQTASLLANKEQQKADSDYLNGISGGSADNKYADFTTDDLRGSTQGDNFSLSFGGNNYSNLEVGSAASEEITRAAEKVTSNSAFIYGGNIYIKTASGGVRRVGGTGKGGVDNKGNGKGQRAYDNLYGALEKAGYILG